MLSLLVNLTWHPRGSPFPPPFSPAVMQDWNHLESGTRAPLPFAFSQCQLPASPQGLRWVFQFSVTYLLPRKGSDSSTGRSASEDLGLWGSLASRPAWAARWGVR